MSIKDILTPAFAQLQDLIAEKIPSTEDFEKIVKTLEERLDGLEERVKTLEEKPVYVVATGNSQAADEPGKS